MTRAADLTLLAYELYDRGEGDAFLLVMQAADALAASEAYQHESTELRPMARDTEGP